MFTGDLEKRGIGELLKRADFRQALQQTRIFVAPHHGREGGCSEEMVEFLTKVTYVVISDKAHQHETQDTNAFYARIAKGWSVSRRNTLCLTDAKRPDDPIQVRQRWLGSERLGAVPRHP